MLKIAQKQVSTATRNITLSSLSMKLTLILSCATLLVGACLAHKVLSELPELEIHRLFKPEDCLREASTNDRLTVHYKAYSGSGRDLDSTYKRGIPMTFQIGLGQVIKGFEQGLLGVCPGEKVKLVIPPHLGYGSTHDTMVHPETTLIFEIEVLKVEDGPEETNVFKDIDLDHDDRLSRGEVGDYLKKQLSDVQGDAGSVSDPDHFQMVDEVFTNEDKNKDDFIAYEEFSGPKQILHDEF